MRLQNTLMNIVNTSMKVEGYGNHTVYVYLCVCVLPLNLRDYKILLSRQSYQWMEWDLKSNNYDFVVKTCC